MTEYEINRTCPYCGSKLKCDIYKNPLQHICYCDNDDCPVKPCTDATTPTRVYAEILAITGDTK